MVEIAWDIVECTGCPHLVFPGDEIVVTGEGQTHVEHLQTSAPLSGAELAGGDGAGEGDVSAVHTGR